VKAWATFAVAILIGLATPVFVLWIGRATPVGTDPSFAGGSVVFALAIVAGLLTAVVPRHWVSIALLLSLPICLLGIVMFALVANLGEYFWAWLWSALGGVAASLVGAYIAAWTKQP
jgi:hypothetical protein